MATEQAISTEHAFMVEFIQKYKEHECLWKTNHEHYSNKFKRLQCLHELLKIMKKRLPYADIFTVKRKINTMRCCFNKQHKRVMMKRVSVDDDDSFDNHARTLRYYKQLLFLVDRNPKKDTSETSDEDIQAIYLENEFSNEEMDFSQEEFTKEEPESPVFECDTPIEVKALKNETSNPKQTKLANASELQSESRQAILDSSYEDIQSTSSKPLYNAFGEHVAEKLRLMPKKMAIYCQKMINEAIFHADIGDLDHTSRIVTDH